MELEGRLNGLEPLHEWLDEFNCRVISVCNSGGFYFWWGGGAVRRGGGLDGNIAFYLHAYYRYQVLNISKIYMRRMGAKHMRCCFMSMLVVSGFCIM